MSSETAVNLKEAKQLLASGNQQIVIPAALLNDLTIDDLPPDTTFQVGVLKHGIYELDWGGEISKDGDLFIGKIDYDWSRKQWYEPLGLEQYMDLVRRAIETRHRLRGDIELTNYDEIGEMIFLAFAIRVRQKNLGKAFAQIRRVAADVEEVAQRAVDDVGKTVAEVAARLSGWGSQPLHMLAEKVETAASTDDKGRILEELVSRIFAQIPGFTVSGRLRTATEEIDIAVINDSSEPRLRREAALVLVECKNWGSKCGKDELVIFREKLENRKGRCSLGFLVSWNGFATTVTREMLRTSRELTLVVPVTGAQIRSALRADDTLPVLLSWWDAAVAL